MAYKSSSAFISLKIAKTETGSVALIKLPNTNASFHVKTGLKNDIWPTNQNINELENIAIKVPRKLYIRTVPPFLKNETLFILYPASKIIGGNNSIIKILPNRCVKFLI